MNLPIPVDTMKNSDKNFYRIFAKAHVIDYVSLDIAPVFNNEILETRIARKKLFFIFGKVLNMLQHVAAGYKVLQ